MNRVLLSICVFILVAFSVSAQVVRKDLQHRNYEPVVLSMQQFPLFIGKKVDQIYLYAFDQSTGTWRAVAFQIDDRYPDASGKIQYNYSTPTDTVDRYDELVFLLRDLGDRVPDGYWLTNPESRQEIRYEIAVVDTLNEGQKAWGYLFSSPTVGDFNPVDYIEYNRLNTSTIFDRVTSQYYMIDFANDNGLPAGLYVTAQNGGNEQDLLDRFKFRVRISDLKVYGISLGGKTVTVNENSLSRDRIYVHDALVRLIRTMRVKVRVEISFKFLWTSTTYTYEDFYNFPIYFYPYNFEMVSDNVNIDPSQISDVDLKIKLIRTSLDLNSNAANMAFLNMFNRSLPASPNSGNLIDGLGGSNLPDYRLVVPGFNYFLITGEQGSIFSTTSVPAIGDQQSVYFYDFRDGSQTMDGTEDTGELGSWGDSGVLITGNNIQGEFKIQNNTFILPPNQRVEVGDTLNANIASPVMIQTTPQTFDVISPAPISDLIAIAEQDTSVTLIWTAPGDDENTGTVDHYDIRYSDQPPIPGLEEDWFDLVATAASVDVVPVSPGEEQRVNITGLDPEKTYYFAVKAFDEADVNGGSGNASPISPVVTVVTFDVQLTQFYHEVDQNTVTIYWTTATEKNNMGFEIQRRRGNDSFETISFVAGNGTTFEPHNYSFTDKNLPAGIYIYRLKQLDFNGDYHLSQEIEVQVALPTDFLLYQNYPNPFNPTTTLAYDVAKETRVILAIFNTRGQLVTKVVDEIQPPGHYTVELNASSWPSGIYFVRLRTNNRVLTRKMILLE